MPGRDVVLLHALEGGAPIVAQPYVAREELLLVCRTGAQQDPVDAAIRAQRAAAHRVEPGEPPEWKSRVAARRCTEYSVS